MEIKELILLYITIQGFVSYVPQIIRLIKTKSAEDCSITSWGIWLINSALYLLYLYLDNVNTWLKLSQLLEVLLIGTTTLLVVILRIKGRCGKHYEH